MSSAPDPRQQAMILQGWQGGVEQLGFLFDLPQQIVMADLVGLLDEFLDLARGNDPTPIAPRSDSFERNLPVVRKTDPDALAFELGCLFGEAVIERYGWRWVRIDDHACGVAAPKNAWLLDPTALLDDARTDPSVDLKARFDELATLSPGTPGALRPLS